MCTVLSLLTGAECLVNYGWLVAVRMLLFMERECKDPVKNICLSCHNLLSDSSSEGIAFLGAFAKFRNVTISFVMSVRMSARKNSGARGRIYMKLDI